MSKDILITDFNDIQINLCEPLKYVGCKFFKNIGTYTAYTNNTLSQQEHE